MFIGLWNFAEDHGVSRGNPVYIRSELYPYDEDVTASDVERWLGMLEAGGFIVRFIRSGSSYLWIRAFLDHQRIDKPSKTRLFPEPSSDEMRALPEPSPNTPRALPVGREGSGVEGNGREAEVDARVPRLPPPEILSISYERPEKPVGQWLGEDFFAWAQWKRQCAGFVAERRKPRNLSAWYSACLMTPGVGPEALQEAFYRFGEDPYWQGRDPPLPFAGFVDGWDKYMPKGAARAAT
jgi:hypothetical protein